MNNDPGSAKAEPLHTYHPGEEEAFLERIIFSFRPLLLIVFLLATVFFAYQTAGLRPDASFEKMIPMEHPYIQSFMKHMSDLGAAGTTIQVAVEHTSGDIFDSRVPGSAAKGQRRGVLLEGRRPQPDALAVDAECTLDRSNRKGIRRRQGHRLRLRRFRAGHEAITPEYPAFRGNGPTGFG